MACSELNPKSNENTEIDKTLEHADDTATNPATSLTTIPGYKMNRRTLAAQSHFGTLSPNSVSIHLPDQQAAITAPHHHRQAPIS